MNKATALIKYNKNSLATQDTLDDMLKTIVKNMEGLILQDVAREIKAGGTKISVIDKLYRAENVDDTDSKKKLILVRS